MPKFFELRTVPILFREPTSHNCSADLLEATSSPTAFPNSTLTTASTTQLYTLISTSSTILNETENKCKEIFRLINNASNSDIFHVRYNESELNSSSTRNLNLSFPDGALTLTYDIDHHMAHIVIIKELNLTILDQTEMRKDTLYYNIYILGLTTVFTQIIPMGILMYFNIKIYTALKVSRVTREEFLEIEKTRQIR